MAMANIICKCECCGKEFQHRHECINSTARANYEDWAKDHITICPECYSKQRAEKRAEEEKNKLEGIELCELSGSEKQVAWADKIRKKAVLEIVDIYGEDSDKEVISEQFSKVKEAKVWIENRDKLWSLKSIVKFLQEV